MSAALRRMRGGSATASTESPIERYRRAERALWDHYGLEPAERFVHLDSPAVRLRVLEVGSGEPVLFVHGSAAGGPVWAPLVRELRDFRCLVLDRPGWGLSSTIDYSGHEYGRVVADVLAGALDALGADRVHVIGNSIGNVWALRLAAAHPSRVGRVVLTGGGPLVPEVDLPPIIRLIASPIGALMVRLPSGPGRERSILRESGHGASLDAGRMDAFVAWRVALARETHSMRNERAMLRAILDWRRGSFRPGLTFEDAELAGIPRPALYLYGTADPVGTADLWRRVVDLLPSAELRLVGDGGHLLWFDDPGRVAGDVRRFLDEGRSSPTIGEAGIPGSPHRPGGRDE